MLNHSLSVLLVTMAAEFGIVEVCHGSYYMRDAHGLQ